MAPGLTASIPRASRDKVRLEDLALFGGESAFDEFLHVGRPNLGNRERFFERLNDMFDRRWLSNDGPYALEFEERIARLLNVRHCVAMCNGTIALEIAIRAAGLTGEVIVPSFTFIATAHALHWQEITPVFCDVDPVTHCIDPQKVEAMITPRTSGIIGVHVWGRPADVEALTDIAERHQLKLIFDAAHALACSHHGEMVGNFGAAEVLSFHATKFLNSFEGGAVVTNDDALAAKVRLMKNFGFSGEFDRVIHPGTNGKMTEVAAAMGITSLESIDEFVSTNIAHFNSYAAELGELPGVRLVPPCEEGEQGNYQYVVVEIDATTTGVSRDALVQVLHAERVLARRYFYPGCHQMEPYRSYYPHAGLLLPETERLTASVMTLPTGTAVSQEDIARLCQIVRFTLAHGQEVTDNIHERFDGADRDLFSKPPAVER